jgi:hypothetical protein
MLLARGARQDVPDNYGCTGLHLTTYYNNKVIVRLLAAAPFLKRHWKSEPLTYVMVRVYN